MLLSDNESVQIVVKPVADREAVELLKRTLYGTSGLRYQQTGQDKKIGQLYNPSFFHLYESGILKGLYCLDNRVVSCPFGTVNGFYGRYFAIDESAQGKRYGHLLEITAENYIEQTVKEPYLFYAFIEDKNARSLAVFKRNKFSSIAQLRTFVFRRLKPKLDKRVSRISAGDLPTLYSLLSTYYENYSLKAFGKINYQGDYFILKEAGQILAGVQANPVRWQFAAMLGWGGKFLMYILPSLPYFNRLFKPNYTFLALEGMYFAPGREDLLETLLESVLASNNLYSALIQIDTRDKQLKPLFDTLKLPSGYQSNVITHVMVKTCGWSADKLHQLQRSPAYCSSFDFT